MPPTVSSSSGSRVPCIGTSVSAASPSGTGASLGRAATQHGSPRQVPSQWRGPRPSSPRGGAPGSRPRAGGSPRPRAPPGASGPGPRASARARGRPAAALGGRELARRQSMLKGR